MSNVDLNGNDSKITSRYKNKHIFIDAIRFDWGGYELISKLIESKYGIKLNPHYSTSDVDSVTSFGIMTSGGEGRVRIGDWVIIGDRGELFCCEDKVFNEKYEYCGYEKDRRDEFKFYCDTCGDEFTESELRLHLEQRKVVDEVIEDSISRQLAEGEK